MIVAAALFAVSCSDDAGNNGSSTPDTGVADAASDATTAPDASADAGGGLDSGADAGVALPPITRENVLDWVDPFIGTVGLGFSYGALTPAVQMPLGMVRVGPDTTINGNHPILFNRFSGYVGDETQVRGFSHLHFVGTGVADYGNMRMLPASREMVERQYRRWFAEMTNEEASPGLYRVRLEEAGVDVALTASTRGAVHRYTWDADADRLVVFDPTSSISDEGIEAATWSIDGTEWTAEFTYDGGYVGRRNPFTLHVAAQLSEAPTSVESWDDDTETWSAATSGSGTRTAALLGFTGDELEVRVGISFIDLEQARANRDAETSGGFDAVQQATEEAWRDELMRIVVEGGGARERTQFYTALYGAFRMPTRLDEGGRYTGIDAAVHDLPDGQERYFTDLSLWDTYRTLHPLWTLIAPDAQRDALASLLLMARDGGYVPRWPAGLSYTGGMEGEPGAVLFGESAAKGLTGVDYQAAWNALQPVADASPPAGATYGARGGIERYIELGWIPADEIDSAASNTLEWSVADHALGALAEAIGLPEDAARMRARGESWKNIYYEQEGFFWPRNADGSWGELESTLAYNERSGIFVEGSAWHYRFHVLHDPEGLAELMGPTALAERLEQFFAGSKLWSGDRTDLLLPDGYYWHTNQPSLNAVVNFAAADRVDRLSYWTRQIQYNAYNIERNGLPGNDDGGTLSSWYVFSAIGLYPVVATDRYVVMPPLFERATVNLEGGETLVVEAPGASREVGIIEEATLNGVEVAPLGLRHAELPGSTIRYELGQVGPAPE
jgi:predicted alpha-1,2-mannosidase